MAPDRESFVSLGTLAARLGLPEKYLRGLADAGSLPVLLVGRRRMFDVGAVRLRLVELSAPREPLSRPVEIQTREGKS